MNKKLRLELEMDEEEEDEEEQTRERPANLNYENCNGTDMFDKTKKHNINRAHLIIFPHMPFSDMYSQLASEDKSFEVHYVLQELMETDVIDDETVKGLWLDVDNEKKRGRDPNVTMEIRHKQVKERRARRDAERERQRREQEARREALEEAKRLDCEEQRRRKQEAQRQEQLLQQEVVRLRREMQEKRSMEQLARKRFIIIIIV